MSSKDVVLSVEIVQGVLGYLATKPYAEVYQLIQAIQAGAKPVAITVEEEEKLDV